MIDNKTIINTSYEGLTSTVVIDWKKQPLVADLRPRITLRPYKNSKKVQDAYLGRK